MSGKERMQNKKKRFRIRKRLLAAGVTGLCSLCFLYGCTRKEELLLLTEEGQEQQEDMQERSEDTKGWPEASDALGEIEEAGAGTAYIAEEPGTIYVHVCGAVMAPGVYEMTAGSRVYEAIQAAGGFTEDAEESYVNQAQELSDGVKLMIPTMEEVQQGSFASGDRQSVLFAQEDGQAHTKDGRVNINTASEEELCKIPGIGATRAAAIVAYRENHGGFADPEDIMKVNGIKEGTYEKIKDSISVK